MELSDSYSSVEDYAPLISGNTLVFKPASDTPLLSIELVKILSDAGCQKAY